MNRKRVQMLRDMIAGLPKKNLNLNEVSVDEANLCGSIGCIGGWADAYPPFKAMGLHGNWEPFFDLPDGSLFAFRLDHEFGSDKQIALRRLDKLLATGTDSTTT